MRASEALGYRMIECANKRRNQMNTIVIVVLGVLFLGVLPLWPYSGNWGYLPSGGLGFLFVVLVLLTLMGRTERTATEKL
jgi:hypothetical protein